MSSLVDAARAAWMQGPVSILIATANEAREPAIGVGLGVRLSEDLSTITVLALDTVSRRCIDDVRAGRPVSLAFTHSASTRALQFKAARGTVAPLAPGDAALLEEHAVRLATEWESPGWQPKGFARGFLVRAPGTLVAISMVPETVFEQTPGPQAGARL